VVFWTHLNKEETEAVRVIKEMIVEGTRREKKG